MGTVGPAAAIAVATSPSPRRHRHVAIATSPSPRHHRHVTIATSPSPRRHRHVTRSTHGRRPEHPDMSSGGLRVLVTVASRYGATREIAERMTEWLPGTDGGRAVGLTAALQLADRAPDPAGFDAVLAGSAVYAGRWLEP